MMAGLAAALVAVAALQGAAATLPRDACTLLTPEDIRQVQEVPLQERKSTTTRAKSLSFDQCVFRTSDVPRSVSLTLISGSAEASRGYWKQTFRPDRSEAALARATRKKDLPRPVAATGDEAFWTGDTRTGALYVLAGDKILRISVGGVADEEERLKRSRTLAQAALGRLHGS